VQKQVAQIQAQAALAGKSPETLAKEREKELRAKAKAEEEKRLKEEAELFKPVQTAQKVPFGVDPKTVLCEFFKAGRCEKGSKCKFSHDRDVGRRVEKKNLYEDAREDKLTGASWVVMDRILNHRCHPQTLWTNGTRRSYGVLSYPSRGTHGQPQKYGVLLWFSHTPDFFPPPL
jgi:Zinc finger C-x8-C-x5-C-x3-H type (and similar)